MSAQENKSHHVTPEEIEDDITETQERIGRRAEALRDGMRPGNLIQEFLPKNASLSDSVDRVIDLAREKPLQSALVGAGLVWLLASDGKSSSRDRQTGYDASAGRRVGDSVREFRRTAAETASSTKRKAGELADAASRTGSNIRSTAAGAAEATAERASELAGTTVDTIGDAPRRIADIGRRGGSWMRENPIPAGLMCIAAGAAIASVFTARNASASSDHETRDESDTALTDESKKRIKEEDGNAVLADINDQPEDRAKKDSSSGSRPSSVLAELNESSRAKPSTSRKLSGKS